VAVDIVDVVGGGRGLARVGSDVWLVAGALPGERVATVVERRRAGIVEASCVGAVGARHPARLAHACPRADQCGGCDWSHVDPEGGAPLKAAVAAGAARTHPDAAASLAAARVQPSPASYRLRARLHWDPDRARLGFYAARSWTVADITDCRVVSPRLAAAVQPIARALAGACPAPVDLEWIEDLAGEATVVAMRPARRGPARLPADWVPPRRPLVGVVDGFHRLDRSGRLGEGWGRTSVRMLLPWPLDVPVGAFFQGNRHLVPWLFDRIADRVGRDRRPVFDLHAGVGFLAAAARWAADRPLTLVEPNATAAAAARRNLPDAEVHAGRTAEEWAGSAGRQPGDSCVILDPPRSGCSSRLLRVLADWGPRTIVMLSCDPATWARDVSFLGDHGYVTHETELVDLFPHTHHVEVLSVLERR
jgi:23S rRNA (uracil1939-C5)-methyltransferase